MCLDTVKEARQQRQATMFCPLVVAVAVAVAVALASPSSMAQDECACFIGPAYALCDDTSITSIPDCVSYNITFLEISTPSIPLVPQTIRIFTNLQDVHISSFDDPQISTTFLSGHKNISSFVVHNTTLEYVDSEWFLFSPGITTLGLHHNKIPSLAADTFSSLPLLDTVTLNNNQLTTLPPTLFQGTALKNLNLADNPWHCDCELATLMQWARDHGVTFRGLALCLYPKKYEGLDLMYLTPDIACTK